MFEGAIKHIEFYYPDYVLSEIFYIEAVPNGTLTNAIAEVNHANQKARGIFMHMVYLETVAAPMRLVDQFNQVIFVSPPAGGNGWMPIEKVTSGPQLRVTNTNGKSIFWISYQYILQHVK